MLPDVSYIVFVLIAVCLIVVLASVLPKKVDVVIELILVVTMIVLLFSFLSFNEAIILFTLGALAYSNVSMFISKEKRINKQELVDLLCVRPFEEMMQIKDYQRIIVDVFLTAIVSAGAITFYVFAPETYMLIKFFILLGLITVFIQMIGRVITFMTTKVYWLYDEKRLIVLSYAESRDFPLQDLKDLKRESSPDLLRLHPLFTFLSENMDYTTSFQPVLKLSFPGENVYFTPNENDKWSNIFNEFVNKSSEATKRILPIWHPKNLKRLFWKGYFAVTVKGISAYTGLLFILIWLEVPSYVIVAFVFIWWLVNLYISDRVLIAGTDAEAVTEGELYARAKHIFNRAGISKTKLYVIDSPIYNGLATGMNIGTGTIMLTKATTELSMDAIEAILAHEAIHVKKRDLLTNQLARVLFFGLLALFVYSFFDQIEQLADNLFVFIPLLYLIMMIFPVYISIVAQWTEMRADYFAAKLLPNGVAQMESGLRELANAQDIAFDKSATYSMLTENRMKVKRITERDNWFFRVIEFQLQPHPPMYYRMNSLSENRSWRETKKRWMIARFKESLPDFMRKSRK